MVSEVGPNGAWSRAFEASHLDKFMAPTVEGIEFPALGVYQAWNDRDTGILHVGTYAPLPERRGQATTWQVRGLPSAAAVRVLSDGEPFTRFDVVGPGTIRLNTTIDNRYYQIFTNYRGARVAVGREPNLTAENESASAVAVSQPNQIRQAANILLSGGGPTCSCCS